MLVPAMCTSNNISVYVTNDNMEHVQG
jgi:hypothetical protein